MAHLSFSLKDTIKANSQVDVVTNSERIESP